MKNIFGLLLLVVFLLTSVSVSFADKAADDKAAADEAAMAAVMVRFDSGELTADQVLALALEQDISFTVIVAACEARLIPLSAIISAAATAGITSEVALARMADAGVSAEKMSMAITEAAGTGSVDTTTGLGYTQDQTGQVTPVVPVTSNPGNTIVPLTVSPSAL